MALYRGGSGPSAIYRGDQSVQKVMRGDIEVWSAADRYDYLESGVLDLLAWSDVEYVIVAGGGGGGGSANSIRGAGGGGAGGVLTGTVTLPPGIHPVSVGAGGTGGAGVTGATGASGGNSTFAEMVAIGGGGASLADNGGGRDGQPGGSGAGGSAQAGLGGAGTPGQGHPGGTATGASLGRGGAGGGGAGGPGQDGASNAPGLGGAGLSVWGRTYAAGGRGGHTGGGGTQNPGDGGQGGYGQGNGWDGAGGTVALKVSASPVVTVTPAAPTFLTASPWYTLPTQEGVTYSITGTPGYGQSVTITATPQVGYELAGQTSWTHTYGPQPSIYPASGTWAGNTTPAATVLATHTIAEDGVYNLTWAVTWAGTGNRYGSSSISRGVPLTDIAGGSLLTSAPGSSTATATSVALSAGELISFRAVTVLGTFPATGEWSIVKQGTATVTVTPAAPTFLTASPWYTLPTQAGVTYTVSGTPGYGQSVTITATPQAGYALAGQTSWEHTYTLPVVTITGVGSPQTLFRQACIDYGTTYDTVEVLPFLLDTSQATNMSSMFRGCSSLITVPVMDTSQVRNMGSMFDDCASLTTVPDMDTSQVTNAVTMFYNCASLTDGNVRLIGKNPSVSTILMISGSGLTRLPFYDTNGNPI